MGHGPPFACLSMCHSFLIIAVCAMYYSLLVLLLHYKNVKCCTDSSAIYSEWLLYIITNPSFTRHSLYSQGAKYYNGKRCLTMVCAEYFFWNKWKRHWHMKTKLIMSLKHKQHIKHHLTGDTLFMVLGSWGSSSHWLCGTEAKQFFHQLQPNRTDPQLSCTYVPWYVL